MTSVPSTRINRKKFQQNMHKERIVLPRLYNNEYLRHEIIGIDNDVFQRRTSFFGTNQHIGVILRPVTFWCYNSSRGYFINTILDLGLLISRIDPDHDKSRSHDGHKSNEPLHVIRAP